VLQASDLSPVRTYSPRLALDSSWQLFLYFLLALLSRSSSPGRVSYISPLALYKIRGISLEYDRVERLGSRSQTRPPQICLKALPVRPFP
jgi:hypothetical protein